MLDGRFPGPFHSISSPLPSIKLYNYSVIEVNNDVFIIKISLMLCKNAIETVMQWFPNNLQISEKIVEKKVEGIF